MKKFFVVTALTLAMLSCQESKEASQKLPKRYDRSVGEQIPLEVARRWANNFSQAHSSGRQESSFSVDAQILSSLLGSIEEKLGVILHHGVDETNTNHLLVFTMGADGELFKGDILDASTGSFINENTARKWAATYVSLHPGTPWYHFFGSDIFSEIQSNKAFEYLDIVRGLNERDEEQVLLFVYNTRGIESGRIEGNSVQVYDVSQSCPPCSAN